MNARRAMVSAITVTGVAAVAAGVALGIAAASPIKWVSVDLGAHRFGQLSHPGAIVARAGPTEVGFEKEGGCGCLDGPQGPTLFDVGRDGSVYLLDVLNHRLLVWQRGRPSPVSRTIELKGLDVRNFAVGRDGTIYLYAVYAEPPPGDSGAELWALSPKGKVRWRAHARIGDVLRLGPHGVLYTVGAFKRLWTPLTSPAGRPLSPAAQRRRSVAFQPLAGGMHLIASQLGAHEVHFALADLSHKVVRAWRVRSRSTLLLDQRTLTPVLIDGDLVVDLDVSRRTRVEHQVLRLTENGVGKRVALDAKAVWGDDGTGAVTALRVGADGRLYQLRTNPKTGVSIARYTLGRRD
jgi:hypothetical protein